MTIRAFAWSLAFSLVFAAGCGDDTSSSLDTLEPPAEGVRLLRTQYGIPHVVANDWRNLGLGYGYAYSQDNFCVLMKEIIRSNGQSSRYFGDEGNLNQDFIIGFYNTDQFINEEFIGTAPQNLQDLVNGYAAGMNKYLNETGLENLPQGDEGCRNAEWVREVTETDLAKVYRKLILRASSGVGLLANAIIAAEAPTMSMTRTLAGPQSEQFAENAFQFYEPTELGSNAYAIGSDASQTGFGILLGNPHFPWTGPERFYVAHLTIPGEYDVMGASLHGVPIINIGFNRDVAWTHTVSTALRFTGFELQLTENDPMKYLVDGEERDITATEVSADVMMPDGMIETRTETIYESEYGPVVDLGAVSELIGGWPAAGNVVFAFRDANLFNTRALVQWFEIGQSTSIAEVREALKVLGIPWVNTIAADKEGQALYADVGVVPHVTQEKLDDCTMKGFTGIITSQGLPTLDGSRSECDWGSDPDTPPGILGDDNLPKLQTTSYAANANDSYWLSNPNMVLEGFSPLIGQERIEQSIRTRQTFLQAEQRLDASDGLSDTPGFTAEMVREIMYGARNLSAELTRNDVVDLCRGVSDWSSYAANTAEAATVCDVLDNWDTLFRTDSVGSHVWQEFWLNVRGTDDLWAVPFDANDPVNTPRDLNGDDEAVANAVLQALGAAVDRWTDNGIPLDRPWGEAQYRKVGSEEIAIHGGNASGMFSAISTRFNEGEGYSEVRGGNSYIQTVTWDETECPDAFAILTYSQSTDPASDHFADMTRLYSSGGWVDMPFCGSDVEAEAVSDDTFTE